MSTIPGEGDATRSLLNVAERALALAKAELNAVVALQRPRAMRLGIAVLLAIAALALAQLSALLIALSPLLVGVRPWWLVLTSVSLVAVPAALCGYASMRLFRSGTERDKRQSTASISAAPDEVESRGPAVTQHSR
jgi:membrane protein implicated in regulation of membrane protease activity